MEQLWLDLKSFLHVAVEMDGRTLVSQTWLVLNEEQILAGSLGLVPLPLLVLDYRGFLDTYTLSAGIFV